MQLFILALSLISAGNAFDTRKIILTDRTIDAVIDSPKGKGPHPLLVIAPGRASKMDDSFYQTLAEAASKTGFVVIRFNWGSTKLTDLKQQAEDLSTVLSSFIQGRVNEPLEINAKQVALLTDGVSARIAMMPDSDALKPNVKALIFLDPECDLENPYSKLYGKMTSIKTSRLLIVSQPGNGCERAQIYEQAKTNGDLFSLYTATGPRNTAATTAVVLNNLQGFGWVKPSVETRNDAKKVKKMTPESHIGHSH